MGEQLGRDAVLNKKKHQKTSKILRKTTLEDKLCWYDLWIDLQRRGESTLTINI